jgi:hypothetical protein
MARQSLIARQAMVACCSLIACRSLIARQAGTTSTETTIPAHPGSNPDRN